MIKALTDLEGEFVAEAKQIFLETNGQFTRRLREVVPLGDRLFGRTGSQSETLPQLVAKTTDPVAKKEAVEPVRGRVRVQHDYATARWAGRSIRVSDKERIFRYIKANRHLTRHALQIITPRYGARLYELRKANRLRYRIEGDWYHALWVEGDLTPCPPDGQAKVDLFPHGREALLQALRELPESEWHAVLGRSYNIKGFLLKKIGMILERV